MSKSGEIENALYNLQQNLPPKVFMIFDGVIEVCNKRQDIKSITVAEIAQAAGVGKGTVYEYFDTKEDLIIKALTYDLIVGLEKLRKVIINGESFRNKIDCGLNWIKENFEKRYVLFQAAYQNGYRKKEPQEIGKLFKIELEGQVLECGAYQDIIDNVMEAGIAEKLIQKPVNKFISDSAVLYIVISYSNFLLNKEKYADTTDEMTKNFLFHAFVRILNE
ncbi:TetR/AcrR family transcriptional regulator [Anaeromicropila populeti]|uniref:Transcriptional regulator, TetR family n=1 Tax=Anaeromicropila populeti TaxID=37658 RepID=A0A1I6K0K6_9FIRM|nr:TetR/AcrR family transcriptional regulator [Anaeromicropila populeti]SFR84350.1 transcriptional regulator, TetR family [Anaeromicropila populeti]